MPSVDDFDDFISGRPVSPDTALEIARQLLDPANTIFSMRRNSTDAVRELLQDSGTERTSQESQDWILCLSRASNVLEKEGDLEGALSIRRRAHEASVHLLGAEHRSTLSYLHGVILLLHDMQKYQEALSMLQDLIAIHRSLPPNERVDLMNSLTTLGRILHAQGRYPDAIVALREAVAIAEEKLGAKHPDTGYVLDSLGGALLAHGELREARQCFDRVDEIAEEFEDLE